MNRADELMRERTKAAEANGSAGFTLIELLVVIAIIAILAAIALPVARHFKPDPVASATQQLMDDFAFARRKAIADHTTVYVLFMPSVLNLEATINPAVMTSNDFTRLKKGQYVSYALYEKRQIGDQPGQHTEHFVTDWRTLPVGTAIAPQKFGLGIAPNQAPLPAPFDYKTFYYGPVDLKFYSNPTTRGNTNSVSRFPYIAFDYRGSLASPWEQWRPPLPPTHDKATTGGFDAVIPITRARISVATTWSPPAFTEDPANAWTNIYNNIVIDGPTGRARVDRQQIQ
jgi:prepilin-type N-terminal cleavage/methylation domain-containing protein